MTLSDTLSYDPSELQFGTSGLRGLLTDMTDLECYINVAGFMKFLRDTDEKVKTVYIAGDLRSSTPHIMAVVAQAISDAGYAYVNCGFIPTPALAYYASLESQPCIMVTGSHIPDDRNGIKFYKCAGEVLKSDENGIHAAVATVRAQIYSEEAGRFKNDGSLASLKELGEIDSAAELEYVNRYINYFSEGCLRNTEIVMYQHSAVGRDLIPHILRALGAQVTEAARSEKFIPIDTENVKPVDEVLFRELAKENPNCFAIVSTDGDSDRPFVIDENGLFNRGDELGYVVSEYLESEAAAFPVSSNDAVSRALSARGVHYELTKIGSPYVIEAMDKLKRAYKNVCGWEVNGGFLVGEDYETGGRVLKALPTRDAFLPIVCAILSAKAKDKKLSELFAELPERYTQAGLIDNFPNELSREIVKRLSKADDEAKRIITETFTVEKGFSGEVTDINSLDGVRITFSNGDVAHIRPSGNAPQLRIYSNADTQERADEMVRLAIDEPNGIYRSIEKLMK